MWRTTWTAGFIVVVATVGGAIALPQQPSSMPPTWRQHKIIPATNAMCQASCDTDEVCRAWARDKDDCRNYAEPINAKPSDGWSGWGVRSTPFPTSEDLDVRRAGYATAKEPAANTVIHGFDIAGYTLGQGQGIQQCVAMCQQDAACKAWTFIEPKDKTPPACWTKFAVGPRVAYAGHTTGLRDYSPPTLVEIAANQARRLRPGYEVIELYRPRVTPRALSEAERREADDLAKSYPTFPAWVTLERLAKLAESGDKKVMQLLLQTLGNGYNPPADAPLENSEHVQVAPTLAVLWGATYWQMHGPDRRAAVAMYHAFGGPQHGLGARPCSGRWDCGVMVTFAAPKDARNIEKAQTVAGYGETGKNPPTATFTFHSAKPRTQTERERFENLMAMLNSYRPVWTQDREFLASYGAQTGRLAEVAAAEQKFKQGQADNLAFQRNLRASDMEAAWKRLVPTGVVHSYTATSDMIAIESLAAFFGGERLEQVGAVAKMTNRNALNKLCEQGSRHCATQTANVVAAERAARVSASQAAGLGGLGLVTQPSNSVQVRTYDSGGNYTGTTTMSGWEAEILGAKPY
ncbi:MAG: hypothetical protein EON61_00430 [Alphaproteobacteria bacterium]|nr:MAG: hypothetical protein EON61_00430 [Alphaproteobacteria bacterium]